MAPNVGLGTEGSVQRGWTLWIVSVVGVVLSALFVLARILQRVTKTGRLGIDDCMIIASLVASGLLSMTECQGEPADSGASVSVVARWTPLTLLSCRLRLREALQDSSN